MYELTSTGRTPVARAVVYCEPCGEETHTFATADGDGFYHFSGDLETGGGIWVPIGGRIFVGITSNKDFEDPPGLPPAFSGGAGWRAATIYGDTRLDIEVVRRAVPTP